MSKMRTKRPITEHAKLRFKERTGWNKQQIKDFSASASRRGLCPAQLNSGPLKKYLYSKQRNKRVKLFNNHVFIFSKNSDKLITVYPVPEIVLQEQAEYEEENSGERQNYETDTECENQN